MSKRSPASLKLNVSSPAEELAAKFVRGSSPWVAWLVGLPVAATAFRLLAVMTHRTAWVAGGLFFSVLLLTWFVWRVTSARHRIGRTHHTLNALLGLGWIATVAAAGPFAFGDALLVVYAVGGLTACLAWNVRYSVHADAREDVLKLPSRRASGQKRFDGAYLVRVAAGRAPVIRTTAERVGKVVPVVVSPWREPGRVVETGTPHKAITAAAEPDSLDHVSPAAQAAAEQMARRIVLNFRDLAAHKVPDLNGAKIKLVDIKPWRVKTEVSLVHGVQTPKVVIDNRGLLASQCALPLTSVIATENRRRYDKVFLDLVLEDVLATARHWPGPTAPGESIAAAPTRWGIYEDRVYAERFGPAITEAMAKALGRPEKNLAHLMAEGMNGSGKSSAYRILVTDGATRLDVVDWLIDTVKKLQTFGPLAEAFEWFATTEAEAKAQIKFLAGVIIPARADYLGARGYDNWEPGCGLPYLRCWVEEGGIIANELDKLPDVMNSARSVGAELDLSVQRAHHALVDTNVRAAFGETISFGCKDADDVFAMPDDLRDAGADPSQWGNKQPGKNYYAAADQDLDRQLMVVRAFKPDAAECREVIAEYAPRREAWIRDNCPDWAELLRRVDVNGVYAKRTTGAAVLAKVAKAEARKNGPATPLPYSPPQPVMADVDDIVVAELVDEGPGAAPAGDPYSAGQEAPVGTDDDRPVDIGELDLDAELREAAVEDSDVDPGQPIPPLDPADNLPFGPRPDTERPREEALASLRSLLIGKGEGFEFAPRDIYDEACPATGRTPGWVRTELPRLADEGLLRHDRGEGVYRVEGARIKINN